MRNQLCGEYIVISQTDGIVLHRGGKNLKLKYSRTPLIWLLFIWIGLALRENVSRILQNYIALKFPAVGSSTVQCFGV
jgi:hypothetical protein